MPEPSETTNSSPSDDHQPLTHEQQIARQLTYAQNRRPQWSELQDYFELLGINGPVVFAIFPPDDKSPCIHVTGTTSSIPKYEINQLLIRNPRHSFGIVVNPPRQQPADWGKKSEHFNKAGFLKAWGASTYQVSHGIACWSEADGGLPADAQLALPALAGLPRPSFSVATGGKSIHHYWLMEPREELDATEFEVLQKRLAYAQKAVCEEAAIDEGLGNFNRVMRAPGGSHPKTGRRTTILRETITGERFTFALLDAVLPPLPESEHLQMNEAAAAELPTGNGWFTRRSEENQHWMAVEMLKLIPKREKPSALLQEGEDGPRGTRRPAIKVLAGLCHHFGTKEALEICHEAGWFGPYWAPEEEAQRIGELARPAGIGSVIQAARQAGWEPPRATVTRKIKAALANSAKNAKEVAKARAQLEANASASGPGSRTAAETLRRERAAGARRADRLRTVSANPSAARNPFERHAANALASLRADLNP